MKNYFVCAIAMAFLLLAGSAFATGTSSGGAGMSSSGSDMSTGKYDMRDMKVGEKANVCMEGSTGRMVKDSTDCSGRMMQGTITEMMDDKAIVRMEDGTTMEVDMKHKMKKE